MQQSDERELVTSKEIQKMRRRALKDNLFGACYLCRIAKVKCSRDRPCQRCVQLSQADLCVYKVYCNEYCVCLVNHIDSNMIQSLVTSYEYFDVSVRACQHKLRALEQSSCCECPWECNKKRKERCLLKPLFWICL